jgi:hypothetical protein
MRLLFKTLRWILTLVLVAACAFALKVILDSRPMVPQDRTLTGDERAWAKDWLRTARPPGLADGERVTLTLSESEANVLGSYLIDMVGEGRIRVRMDDSRAHLIASLGLPWDPVDSFVNLELTLVEAKPLPRIERARLAGVPLPDGLVQGLADRLIRALDQSRVLQAVVIKPDIAMLTYEWHPNALENLGSGLVSDVERTRLIRYQGILDRYGARIPKNHSIPLADLLSHLLFEARYQGPKGRLSQSADPGAENRAAILGLAAYVNRATVRDPADRRAENRPIAFRTVELRGRRDLAQHFMTSAAIAAEGGDALSNLLGLFKEVKDTDGGSGFSFADLAADRAGARFAQRATGDRTGALAVQGLAQQGLAEDDIMPPIDGLPERIGKGEFATDYRDTRSPAYRAVAERIERRIDRLTLHRPEGG